MKKLFEEYPLKVTALSWCNNIEDSAMEQLSNVAGHPWVKHIAVMPDCLTDDTEVLTTRGFVLIKELNIHDNIANYDNITRKVFFKEPKNIIKRNIKELEAIYKIVSKNKTLPFLIQTSENHRNLINSSVILSKDLKEQLFIKDFTYSGEGLFESDVKNTFINIDIQIISWIVGDGSFKKNPTNNNYRIRFGLKKERKINRLEYLLKSKNISYIKKLNKRNYYDIIISTEDSMYFYKMLNGVKTYPQDFLFFNTEQANIFKNEIIQIDGSYENFLSTGHYRISTKSLYEADLISSIFSIHFGMTTQRKRTRYTNYSKSSKSQLFYVNLVEKAKLDYSKSGYGNKKLYKELSDYKGELVCIECDTSFFIARQNGLIFITGNCHTGIGVTIGSVIAFENAICPNAVGVDIGCGMSAYRTTLTKSDLDKHPHWLKEILGRIRDTIPHGVGKHNKESQAFSVELDKMFTDCGEDSVVMRERQSAHYQIGSLGSGNHFIEIQEDEQGVIWIMIHSGSRNLGYEVCKRYEKIANELCEQWMHKGIVDKKLSVLPIGTKEATNYIKEMNCCLQFAYESRKIMLNHCLAAFNEVLPQNVPTIKIQDYINIHHNYAALENHFGHNYWIHRKGATSAKDGELGIIPGSQGTASYIVRGKGNVPSMMSCSHGAGRKMSRTEARNTLDFDKETKFLEDQGILHGIRHTTDLEEASSAYKDIDDVIEQQKDLVDVEYKLKPLGVIKG